MNNLYIKYAPKSLEEVKGHPQIIRELYSRFKGGTLTNVIFLHGPTGVGKTVLSRIIAKQLLCESPKDSLACNVCQTCVSIHTQQLIPNYSELNSAEYGKDEILQLAEYASKRSSLFKNQPKVIILNEFQSIKSEAAEQVLLTALEKGTTNTYWILITMDDSQVHPAIKSRGIRYELLPLSGSDILKGLVDVCQKESIDISQDEQRKVLSLIAEYSNGNLRQALSYLERVIGSNLWTEFDVYHQLHLASIDNLSSLILKMAAGNEEVLSTVFDEKLLSSLGYTALTLYKREVGVPLPRWQLSAIKDVPVIYNKKLLNIMEWVDELMSLSFKTPFIIEMRLLKMLLKNKGI